MSETSQQLVLHSQKADASLAIIWSLRASVLIKEKIYVYLSGFLPVAVMAIAFPTISVRRHSALHKEE